MRKLGQIRQKKSKRIQKINGPPEKYWPNYRIEFKNLTRFFFQFETCFYCFFFFLFQAILFFFQSQAIHFYFFNADNEEISPESPEKINAGTNN